MNKLLVNTPTGKQEIIEVGPGGGYFDADRVVWDEREDGPLPEGAEPGRLVRTETGLKEDLDFDPRSELPIEQLRKNLVREVRKIAHVKRDAGIDFNGVRVGTDSEARSLILGGRVNPKERRKIVTKSGQRAELTGSQFTALVDAVDSHIQGVIDNEYRLLGEIESAASVDDLLALDVDGGWPS